jgi:uncharacterized protein (DUF362 family)
MNTHSRREVMKTMGFAAIAAGANWKVPSLLASPAPTAPVAVSTCKTYDSAELLSTLSRMFDQLGGLQRIVGGKTVAIKINCTGAPNYRVGYLPLGDTHYTSPEVLTAAVHLMGKAGAKRIRIVESPWSSAAPLEESLLLADFDPRQIASAASNVEFENTNFLGKGKKYSRLVVPFGGYLYPAFELNHSYTDCDAFVSITKLKEHETTGFTLSMKNCFGITPCSIYGSNAGIDDPNEDPKGGRGILHGGNRQPSKIAPAELDPTTPRHSGYRVPRAVVDLVAARPIDLQIIDGVKSISGGEGPWAPGIAVVQPGLLIAGTNPVATDAVGMALMGLDPMADRGTYPFEVCDNSGACDNMLRLAEEAGLGTRDLNRIEVIGAHIKDVAVNYAAQRTASLKRYGPIPTRGISPALT